MEWGRTRWRGDLYFHAQQTAEVTVDNRRHTDSIGCVPRVWLTNFPTMKTLRTRREFFTDVGRGMLVASVGYEVANGLGLSTAFAEEPTPLSFGELEPL